MQKVIYIRASFKPVGKNVTKNVPTGEKKKTFFGGEKDVIEQVTEWEQTGYSDCQIDGALLAEQIGEVIASLNSEGYKVVQIIPVTSGRYNWDYKVDSIVTGNHGAYAYAYGYGYSYTEGVTIVAERIAK